jgi:chromosomal replication initiation ATPase DnaA
MITTDHIFEAVSTVTQVSKDEILGPVRSRRVVWARWLVAHFLDEINPHWSQLDITLRLNRSEPSSVHYMLAEAKDLLASDSHFQRLHLEIHQKLHPIPILSA